MLRRHTPYPLGQWHCYSFNRLINISFIWFDFQFSYNIINMINFLFQFIYKYIISLGFSITLFVFDKKHSFVCEEKNQFTQIRWSYSFCLWFYWVLAIDQILYQVAFLVLVNYGFFFFIQSTFHHFQHFRYVMKILIFYMMQVILSEKQK